MAPSIQARSKRGRNVRRSSTQFGQLEVDMEPAIPSLQQQQNASMNYPPTTASRQTRVNEPQTIRALSEEYENELADDDLMQFDLEKGRVGDISRRSSPVQGQVPENTWKYDGDSTDNDDGPMPPTSSPKLDNLPDTVPIPTSQGISRNVDPVREEHLNVDLSETASTARGSPSVRESEARALSWGVLNRLSSSRATSKHPAKNDEQSSEEEDELPPFDSISAGLSRATHPTDVPFKLGQQSEMLPSQLLQQPKHPDIDGDVVSEIPDTRAGALILSPSSLGEDLNVTSNTNLPTANVKGEAHDSPVNTIRANADVSHYHEHHGSFKKRQNEEHAPDSSIRSGKKRKQRAKEPLGFDSETQAVKEGPPLKKRLPPMAENAEDPTKKATATTGTKRTNGKTTARATKTAKAIVPSHQTPSRVASKRPGNRAAAQLARRAVQQQLSSSPSPAVNAAETQDSKAITAKSLFGSASKHPSGTTETSNSSSINPSSKAHCVIDAPNSGTKTQKRNARKSISKGSNESFQHHTEKTSSKQFGGVPGRMYSTVQTKLPDTMIKDSQDDTQDLIQAHLAEAKVAEDHISISSDHNTTFSETEIVDPRIPNASATIIAEGGEASHGSDHPVMPGSIVMQADSNPQGLADVRMEEEIPDSMSIPIFHPAPRPEEQHSKAQSQEPAQARPVTSSRASKVTKKTLHEALAPSENDSAKRETVTSAKLSNTHRGVRHLQAKDGAVEHKDVTSQRHLQRHPRPGDAFADSDEAGDRGRSRVKCSGWTRTLTVSQAGSPSRLSTDGNEKDVSPKAAPVVSSIKDNLDHFAGDRPPELVSRRLSYRPNPAPDVKRHEAPIRESELETTEMTLVGSGGSGNSRLVPARPHNARSQAELSKVKTKIYDQMISAVYQPEEHQTKHSDKGRKKPSPMKPHRVNIAGQLHGIIDLVSNRLEESEKTIGNTINVYQEGTSSCVGRIERRLEKERPRLLNQWKDDGKRFIISVEKAKKPIMNAPRDQRETASKLERDVSQRQLLYDHASSSLRSFHNQIMRG